MHYSEWIFSYYRKMHEPAMQAKRNKTEIQLDRYISLKSTNVRVFRYKSPEPNNNFQQNENMSLYKRRLNTPKIDGCMYKCTDFPEEKNYTSTEGNVSHDLDWRLGGTIVSNSFFISHGDAS